MSWTAPLTAVATASLSAAQWNASVRDNLLETAPAKATAAGQVFVATAANAIAARTPSSNLITTIETTTSTTSGVLPTAGPSVSVVTGSSAFVAFGAWMRNNTSGDGCQMYIVVSGATTVAEAAENSAIADAESASNVYRSHDRFVHFTGLTPGTNVFTAKYQAVGGGTATFGYRRLFVFPL